MALNDEPMTGPMPDAPVGNGAPSEPPPVEVDAAKQAQKELEDSLVEAQKSPGDVKEPESAEQVAQNGKSDSEAETEILSGKEDDPKNKSRKSIKLEEPEYPKPDVEEPNDKTEHSDTQAHLGARKTSLKRKRGTEESHLSDGRDEQDSSKLSSTVSSPVIDRRTTDDIDSKSDQSESSPPLEDTIHRHPDSTSKKRQSNAERHHQNKRDHVKDSVNGRKRRDTRSATDLDEPVHRSVSPPSRKPHRAQSTQSNTSQLQGVKKRRKTPAPLHVDRRNRASEDANDSDSSSVQSHHRPQNSKPEGSSTWKASKFTSKKNKDRSGRTRLARACVAGVSEAKELLKERPEDIDVADNAGNTPLQIAALEGNADIVKLLLGAGCTTDTKNVDNDTPLIDAVENGHLDVVQLLLNAGADPAQRNATGKEPIELVNTDIDDHEEIRAALQASKKDKEGRRRQSEDHNRQRILAPREHEASAVINSGPSPTHSTRSPPLDPGARRRTARSQHTNDALLWVNPTPQRLRDAAGKGDMSIVHHILNMRPQADTEAVLAAAQGGHDQILSLMIALASPDPDPSPLRSPDLKPGHTTPVLAAIGRGNVKVLDLLVHQAGFDPTRKPFKGMTYYELAKERQSPEWQEEYDLLKNAYDQYKKNGGRRSNNSSPQKVRSKRAESRTESRKSSPEPSSSPHEVRKVRRPATSVKEEHDGEPKRRPSYQGTALKQPDETRKLSSVPSDNEKDARKTKDNKHLRVRSTSPSQPGVSKPRRRLLSGNDVKTDQDSRRKIGHATEEKDRLERRKSGDSLTSHGPPHRRSSDASMSAPPTKKATSESPRRNKEESSGKKRLRTSVSPNASRSEVNEGMKKKKRLRIDSHGNAIDQGHDRPPRPGPAPPANMVPTPSAVSSPSISAPATTAPVAFMGSATASPATRSPIESQPRSTLISPVGSIDHKMHDTTDQLDIEAQMAAKKEEDRKRQEEEELQRQEQLEKERVALVEAEERQKVEAERQAQLKKQREEAEREAQIAREKEEEAERQAQEEQRKKREELEAQARKRREEEMQKRRVEQERQRKIEQEKRRREAEQREIAHRLQVQQEEERLRRSSLPNGLRRYFELEPDEARSSREISKWLPLRTVTTLDLDLHCNEAVADERWIANVQAAPLLANKDLELSQYTAWSRRPTTPTQCTSLWRQLRNPMAQVVPHGAVITPAIAFTLENETKPKFLNLNIFWIKLTDFMDIVPRHPHLSGMKLTTRDFVLEELPFGAAMSLRGGGGVEVKEEGQSPPVPATNGWLVNGYT